MGNQGHIKGYVCSHAHFFTNEFNALSYHKIWSTQNADQDNHIKEEMFQGSFVMRNETSWFIIPEAHSPWLATLIAVDELQEACICNIVRSYLGLVSFFHFAMFYLGKFPGGSLIIWGALPLEAGTHCCRCCHRIHTPGQRLPGTPPGNLAGQWSITTRVFFSWF